MSQERKIVLRTAAELVDDDKVIKAAIKADSNMRIRLTAEDNWYVYMYSQPDPSTVVMTRKTMTYNELANFIRSGEFAKGEP